MPFTFDDHYFSYFFFRFTPPLFSPPPDATPILIFIDAMPLLISYFACHVDTLFITMLHADDTPLLLFTIIFIFIILIFIFFTFIFISLMLLIVTLMIRS